MTTVDPLDSITSQATATLNLIPTTPTEAANQILLPIEAEWRLRNLKLQTLTNQTEYNILNYGAVPDGVTDNTPVIQAILNAMPATNGGILYIPPGNFCCMGPSLTIPPSGNITVVGAGWASKLIMCGPWTGFGSLFQAGAVGQVVPNLFFEDFAIDGQNQIKAGTTVAGGIALRNILHARVFRVSFINCCYQTLQVAGGSDVTISHCYFNGGGNGTQGASSDHISINNVVAPVSQVIIANNVSIQAPDSFIECDGATDIVIANNYALQPAATGVNIAGGTRIAIIGNNIYDVNAEGLEVLTNNPFGALLDIDIVGNVLTATGTSGSAFNLPIIVGIGSGTFNARNINIIGNLCRNFKGNGIQINNNPGGNLIQNVNIVGNLVDNCQMGIDCFSNGGNIDTVNIADNIVINTIHPAFGGINVRGIVPNPTNYVIKNNTITNGAGVGIYIQVAFTGLAVTNNYLNNNTAGSTNLTIAQKATNNWFNNLPQDTSGIMQLGTTSLYSGAGVPAAGLGANGDIYFNTTGGAGTTMYQKRAGAWVATAA